MGKYDQYAWAKAPDIITDEKISETVSCDVCVVGAGLSGITAALRCTENGLNTVLIEKGRHISARGMHVGVANSRLIKKYGIENDIHKIADEWISLTGHRAKIDVIYKFLRESEPAMDWILDKTDAAGIKSWLFGGGYTGTAYKEYPCTHLFEGSVEGLAKLLFDTAVSNGARTDFLTSACQLLKDGDRITGVIAEHDGNYIKYLAKKGVILATGDISGNKEMCEDLAPLALKAMMNLNHHSPKLTGDGHRMGVWVGADMQNTPFPCAIHLMAFGGYGFFFLLVNQSGRRYMNEDCWGQGKSVYTIEQDSEHPWGYIIFDKNYIRDLENTIDYGGGLFWDLVVREWGKPYNSDYALHGIETAAAEGQVCWKADTLEALSEKIGVPYDTFRNTVQRYNELCEKGVDEDFGKRKEFLTPVSEAPFYAMKISGALLHIPAGLSINDKMQVLDTHGKVIEGLYAIGNVSGGLYAVDYPLLINGGSHGRCLVFGKLAADEIAKSEK